MKTKQLPTKEELHDLFEYRDGELYWRNHRSNKVRAGSKAGSIDGTGYHQINIKGKVYRVHRIIYSMHYDNLTPDLLVDHIDNNKSNNKICNLRIATSSQNSCNQSMNKNNTSGVKGVCWHKQHNKWYVQVQHKGKNFYGGLFDDFEDAKQKAEQLRNQLHSTFTNHG
jgi:hypothetical protein